MLPVVLERGNDCNLRSNGEYRGWGPAFARPKLNRISFIGNDGHGYSLDRSSGTMQEEGEIFDPERYVGFNRAIFSESRGVAYFISGRPNVTGTADFFDQINCADADTLATRATLSTPLQFFSIAISGDGNNLYAVSGEHPMVTVIDALTMRELRHFSVGQRPSFVLAAP